MYSVFGLYPKLPELSKEINKILFRPDIKRDGIKWKRSKETGN